MSQAQQIIAIIPAAGVGKRMGVNIPKQYLSINNKPILSHTLGAFLKHPKIDKVIVAISKEDEYFADLKEIGHPKLIQTIGGAERADTVLAAIEYAQSEGYNDAWALVHDAARPCITHVDIDLMLESRQQFPQGAILAMPVRDTMKRAGGRNQIVETVCREQLWHAMTPQMFPINALKGNLINALQAGAIITDEASAMEWAGESPGLVAGRPDNIKVTHAEDLQLARLYIEQHERNVE
ncbi:2-C-methyl-D-erythritol 4-phosphate cytidylyltransferase [Shewanella sp. 202IG2-18]|uniref:2-C-methyl-D-erythritol 4-phosphate cytidylyltransferase n=1 Tax=Parashewanella hymeniacidonis TaxID=2807618 RepID=UPI00195F9F44|nr:2-C-methyl-D-erythritol 4-phosphate cytidylyltransferase [Parashewanella hymeniacidonis]MBM7071937.1 2-C-methyl-D-erythritol 4-phosphate cytidylyltransferase [Parashewanella hymeniacidonis]